MEEFSFPTAIVTDQEPISHLPFPSFTTTTSLWFHSPEADSSSHLRRSFSEGGANIATTCRRALRPSGSPAALSDCDDGLMEYEERMDMLWEDFNEEIYRASLERDRAAATAADRKSSRRRSVGMDALAAERGMLTQNEPQHHGAAAELRLMPALEVLKSGPLRRKPGLVVMLRMLKRLFVVQKSHSSKRESKQQK